MSTNLPNVRGFTEAMKDQGIHLGMPRNNEPGRPVRCVTCGELWPCKAGGLS